MIVFCVDILSKDVESYMAVQMLPQYFENMKLEMVHFDPTALNASGSQPLRLTYARTGRIEDLELSPDEHAFPILSRIHPYFQPDRAMFMPGTPYWLWDDEKMRILFTVKPFQAEPSGEVFGSETAYVSISRKQIFISFEAVKEYLVFQILTMGLDLDDELTVGWDDSRGGVVGRSGPLTIQWILDSTEALEDILRFLGLDLAMDSVQNWLQTPPVTLKMIETAKVTDRGMIVPLILREKH